MEEAFPTFQIDLVPWDAMVTMDYCTDRIRVVDNGMVKETPRVA